MAIKYEHMGYSKNYEESPIKNLILNNVKNFPLLDVGCGNGNLLKLFKGKGEIEGIDISEVAVKLTRKRGIKAGVSSIDDFKPKKKYKTVLLIGVLTLCPDPRKALLKISSWLDTKQGIIILTVPNKFSPFFKRDKNMIHVLSYFEFNKFLKKDFIILKRIGAGRLKFPLLSKVNFYVIKPRIYSN